MSRLSMKKILIGAAVVITLSVFTVGFVSAQQTDATDEQIAAAVKGGQKYLADTFVKDSDTVGHWTGSYGTLSNTAFAVSALLETGATGATGRTDELTYEELISMGIAHVLTFVKTNGGIYSSYASYETGLSLVALALYGQQGNQDNAYKTIVQNAVEYLITTQTTCTTATGSHGGWTYTPTGACGSSDLSNTQYAVMGLFFGAQYLGLPVAGQDWTVKLLAYLKNSQASSGGFSYNAISVSEWVTNATNAGGIWCLAMIDQANAKKNEADANTMVQNAVSYFNSHYGWTVGNYDYYFVYTMSKALGATIGTTANVGDHNWVQDLKNAMWAQVSAAPPVPQTDPPTANSWYYDYDRVMETSWVLMSLAFADPMTEGYSKIVPAVPVDEPEPPPITGLVTLQSTSPVTISNVARNHIHNANKAETITLPVGVFDFRLNNVPVGQTTVLTISVPAGALDPTNPDSFVDENGLLKDNIKWFKISGGAWKGVSSVPVVVDTDAGVIRVTLRDGGPEDEDGSANGKINDPGGPGIEEGTTLLTSEIDDSSCFIATAAYGSSIAPDVIMLRAFRDKYLLTNPAGRAFVNLYYRMSPPLARLIAGNKLLKSATRAALSPVIFSIKQPAAFFLIVITMVGVLIFWRRNQRLRS